MSAVRTRVAPSPTGDPHVGTAYQALLNYAFAKRHGGQFLLRIEDTDRARSSRASEEAILRSLRWLGLSWDEGPDCGGPCAPYRQSERVEACREAADGLLRKGAAYRDHGGGGGDSFAIRLRTPETGRIALPDRLRPGLTKDWESVDDPVLLKSDGFPTYHLANVVDDHLMGITDVIRGEEWIPSLPKHLLLYEALGWTPPSFWHVPLLRNDDRRRSKLSKRNSPTSIDFYRDAGFLPEALLNFLGMLVWTRAEGEEKFTLDEFVAHFDLGAISLAGPVFDVRKLEWLNGRYLREDHDAAGLVGLLHRWRFGRGQLEAVARLAQPRIRTLGEFAPLVGFFLSDRVPLDRAALAGPDEPKVVAERLLLAEWALEDAAGFTEEAVHAALGGLAASLDLKLRQLTRPLYLAVTGSAVSTPLFASMAVLGSDMTRMRIRRAREALGGVSRKRRKKLARARGRR